MAYLGNQPTIGAYHKLDAISTVNGQATYNLLLDSVAFTPQSANHMLVVVNGIVQSPTTNYTISGSTITFTGNLVTGDVINEIRVFGDVLNIGTPSDATVTNAKTNFVSTSSAAGLSIKGDGTTDGTVQLNCSQNSHGVKIASPAHSAGQSYTIKLPTENIAADKIMKVASISGSGTTAIGQMSFVDEPSGGLKFLATSGTISSGTSAVDFNSSILTTTYGAYMFVFEAVFDSVSSGSESIVARLSADNGSTIPSSGYRTANWRVNEGGTTSYRSEGTVAELRLGRMNGVYQGNAAGEGLYGKMFLYDPTTSSMQTRMEYQFITIADRNTGYTDESLTFITGASAQSEPLATNFIRFFPNSGTFEGGVIRCYGIVDS
jgi:hypothetical protein